MERQQRIKKVATRTVCSTNYTLSGSAIRGGRVIVHGGEAAFYPCGHERAPGIDSCSCGM